MFRLFLYLLTLCALQSIQILRDNKLEPVEFRLLKLKELQHCSESVFISLRYMLHDLWQLIILRHLLSEGLLLKKYPYRKHMALYQTSLGMLFASSRDTTPCSSKDNHLQSFRKNLLPSSSGEKVVPTYRADAAAGCILGHMIYCWITTPLPLFTRFDSQLVPVLPKIKLHLEGTKI